MFFNLIPLPPLDGANVLAGFLPEPISQIVSQTLRRYGMVVLSCCCSLGSAQSTS